MFRNNKNLPAAPTVEDIARQDEANQMRAAADAKAIQDAAAQNAAAVAHQERQRHKAAIANLPTERKKRRIEELKNDNTKMMDDVQVIEANHEVTMANIATEFGTERELVQAEINSMLAQVEQLNAEIAKQRARVDDTHDRQTKAEAAADKMKTAQVGALMEMMEANDDALARLATEIVV